MADKYDVIVIGSGPGGTSAAKTAAEKNLKVLMLERAKTPGDKQVSGSYLWRGISEEIFPGFEKAEMNQGQIRLGGFDYVNILDNDEKRYGFRFQPGEEAMRGLMTVYRNETDKWFAEQCVKAGVELKTALATDVIWDSQGTENERVVGVVTDNGEYRAPMIIDASGLHSRIARRSGLTKWGVGKICLGMKYIYRVDPEVLRKRMATYWGEDGCEVDWGCTQMMTGVSPDYFCAHATGMPGKDGIVSIAFYNGLKEMVENKVNIHQRAQWYIKEPTCQHLIEGGEFIYADFHGLAVGDLEGYPRKSYLPGLVLVGDAGGFADPLINWGANVAMEMGRMAGNLAAEMKTKNDYSEAMFAKYEDMWKNSFIGEGDTHEWCRFWREGEFMDLMWTIDDVVVGFAKGYLTNNSYPSLMLGAMPKLIQAAPAVVKAVGAVGQSLADVAVNRIDPFLRMLGINMNNNR
ncbi:NAD(P)/FAD-dependent oxidoreductase [Chloroflexota bacterium]